MHDQCDSHLEESPIYLRYHPEGTSIGILEGLSVLPAEPLEDSVHPLACVALTYAGQKAEMRDIRQSDDINNKQKFMKILDNRRFYV